LTIDEQAAVRPGLSSDEQRNHDHEGRRPKGRLMAERIVSARIPPAIGMARVGDSTASPFVGPEPPGATPHPPGVY